MDKKSEEGYSLRKSISLFLLAASLVLLTACCADEPADTAAGTVSAAPADAVSISLAGLSNEISFIDIQSGDTPMQILARIDETGTPRLAWNTCRVCAGSPLAYFDLDRGYLVCQNCGNSFFPDAVGGSGLGCYPWSFDDYTVSGDQILIPGEAVSAMAGKFRNWKKGL